MSLGRRPHGQGLGGARAPPGGGSGTDPGHERNQVWHREWGKGEERREGLQIASRGVEKKETSWLSHRSGHVLYIGAAGSIDLSTQHDVGRIAIKVADKGVCSAVSTEKPTSSFAA